MSERDNLVSVFGTSKEDRRTLWQMAGMLLWNQANDLPGECHTRPLLWITTSRLSFTTFRAYIVQADVRFKSSRLAVDHANPQINNPYCRSAQINRQRFHLSAD